MHFIILFRVYIHCDSYFVGEIDNDTLWNIELGSQFSFMIWREMPLWEVIPGNSGNQLITTWYKDTKCFFVIHPDIFILQQVANEGSLMIKRLIFTCIRIHVKMNLSHKSTSFRGIIYHVNKTITWQWWEKFNENQNCYKHFLNMHFYCTFKTENVRQLFKHYYGSERRSHKDKGDLNLAECL